VRKRPSEESASEVREKLSSAPLVVSSKIGNHRSVGGKLMDADLGKLMKSFPDILEVCARDGDIYRGS
jgi:hypothetical protein